MKLKEVWRYERVGIDAVPLRVLKRGTRTREKKVHFKHGDDKY